MRSNAISVAALIVSLTFLVFPRPGAVRASNSNCVLSFASPMRDPGDGRMAGRVIDARSKTPVQAKIEAMGRRSVWVGITSGSGTFSAYLPPDRYSVTVSRPGYSPLTKSLNVARNKTAQAVFPIRADVRPSAGTVRGVPAQGLACAPEVAASAPGGVVSDGGGASGAGPQISSPGSGAPGGIPGAAGNGVGGSNGSSSGGSGAVGASGTGVGSGESSATSGTVGDSGAAGATLGVGGDITMLGNLELTTTVFTRHGNAAQMAWSDDGKAVFLANEEGVMSAVKIDAADPANPQITASKGDLNFLWAAAQRNGLLVFQPSLGDITLSADPATLSTRWQKRTGSAHALATDGSRVFVPAEGKPAALIVLGSDGQEIARVPEPDGWWRVYSLVYDDSTRRLYVGAGDNVPEGFAGGIYIYDVASSPVKLGVIPGGSWDISARGSWVWRSTGNGLEAWNVAEPSRPRRTGSWQGATESGPGGTLVRPQVGPMAVRRDGTRLYVSYRSVTATGGHPVGDWHGGFMIFNVSEGEPRLILRHGWKTDIGYWVQPLSLALSPDQSTVAVSYWAFGVRFFRVAGDRVIDQGMVATTGEAHDVYADGLGFLYVFANDDIQIIDERTGKHVGAYVTGSGFDGQWRPFKDGTIILPSARNAHSRLVLRMIDGKVELVATLSGPASTWDEIFEDPYLYSATDRGLAVQRIGPYDSSARRYPLTVHPSVDVGGALLAITKFGSLIWGLGPSVGVVAIDVSVPTSPRVVFRDSFAFGVNGGHAGIIAARGRIYAGAGDAGLITYDPANRRRVGQPITGLNVNFLDKVADDFLIVANYWFTRVLEGMVIYDLRDNPDAPRLVRIFPGDGPNANFRARVFGNRIYRVPLYGVDVLDLR